MEMLKESCFVISWKSTLHLSDAPFYSQRKMNPGLKSTENQNSIGGLNFKNKNVII